MGISNMFIAFSKVCNPAVQKDCGVVLGLFK